MAVSFDLFGTLFAAAPPEDPAAAVATELRRRDVAVPDDWASAYREPHLDAPDGAEVPLPDHVSAALESRGVAVPPDGDPVGSAVLAAFDREVRTLPGAIEAVDAAADRGPVGVLSNCSVPGLVGRAIDRSALDPGRFDAVVTSVGCGWRKPDGRAFEAVADRLGVSLPRLRHVGDDPATDGGAEDAGATALIVNDRPLVDLADRLGEDSCP